MTRSWSLSLSLELCSDGQRIAGRLVDQDGNRWPFSSCLGLLTLIERLRASAVAGCPAGTNGLPNPDRDP
jgi:hypothetical protein